MFNSLLSAMDMSILVYVILGVVLVLMIVLTIVPQKKRQKQQQQMMNSLTVGTKIMTIGRMVGKITQVNADNTLIVNVGTESSPTLIVIDKNAVGLVLENVAQPVQQAAPVEEKKEEAAQDEVIEASEPQVEESSSSADISDTFEEIAAFEETAEAAEPAKPKKSNKKK